jgi:hypothetical protein
MLRSTYCLVLSLLIQFLPHLASGQATLQASFVGNETQITQGEILSNVLRIQNPTSSPIQFYIKSDFPFGWRLLSQLKDQYTIAPNDSLFLPIRLIPSGNLTGNNRFMVTAYLMGMDDRNLATSLFWAFTVKRTSWTLSNESGNKVYFKNGQTSVPFDLNIVNTGTEKQPIILTVNNMSLYSEITADSSGKNKLKQPINLALQPYEDTSFTFHFRYIQGARNTQRIDLETYRPDNLSEERVFNVIINSEEPQFNGQGAFQAGQRYQFKKLSDNKIANTSNYSRMPFIVDYNVNNLLNDVAISTLNVRGVTQLTPSEQLVYNLQATATGGNYQEFLENNNYYLGYFYKRGNIQVGYINGGFMGIQSFGRGVRSTYNIDKQNKHAVTGYYITKEDRFNRTILQSHGLAYDVKYYKQNKARLEAAQSTNFILGTKTNALNGRVGVSIFKTQTLNLSLANTFTTFTNSPLPQTARHGYFATANYNGNFLKGNLNINHGVGFNNPSFANSNIERFFYTHRVRAILNEKWSATFVNNFNRTATHFLIKNEIVSFTNQFAINRSFKTKNIQPLYFYNHFRLAVFDYDMTGVGINFNSFNPKTGTRFASTFETGVNIPKRAPTNATSTFMQVNALLFYRTLTANFRYVVGTYGYVPPTAVGIASRQQLLTTSAQHQYVFKNTKIMLQTGVNYFYNSAFKQHSASIFPDLYYFTTDGWRFRLGVNLNMISSQALQNIYNQQAAAEEPERVVQQSTFVSAGIRKEFLVPVPFKKVKYGDVDFVVFFDANGNSKKDQNERVIENVVIRLGDEELITNEEGTARMRNVPLQKLNIAAFPLEEASGWYPNIEDSIPIVKHSSIAIPFVRGVRIKGKVNIDRDAINADATEPFDLSRIKITAVGNKTFTTLTDFNGNFETYLPYGKYILTLDESVLGTKYQLAKNNYEVELTKASDGLVISFLILEKKRKVVRKVFAQPEPQVAPPANPTTPPSNQNANPPRKRSERRR